MQKTAVILMLVLVGCSTANRQVALDAAQTELKWPFEPPVWAQVAFQEQPPAVEIYAGRPKVLVGVEFITPGPLVEHYANLFKLQTEQRVVLDPRQTASLKLLIQKTGDSSCSISSRILLYETQPAYLGMVRPHTAGGYRFCCQCFAEQIAFFEIHFTAEIARPGAGQTWDMESSWRLEDHQLLKPGQSVLCLGGPDEDGHPMLLLVTLLDIHHDGES